MEKIHVLKSDYARLGVATLALIFIRDNDVENRETWGFQHVHAILKGELKNYYVEVKNNEHRLIFFDQKAAVKKISISEKGTDLLRLIVLEGYVFESDTSHARRRFWLKPSISDLKVNIAAALASSGLMERVDTFGKSVHGTTENRYKYIVKTKYYVKVEQLLRDGAKKITINE